jgi:hypothetical protein
MSRYQGPEYAPGQNMLARHVGGVGRVRITVHLDGPDHSCKVQLWCSGPRWGQVACTAVSARAPPPRTARDGRWLSRPPTSPYVRTAA